MDRNASGAQIVIADWEHAHDREHTAHHGKLGSSAETDCAVALFRDALKRICFRQAFMQVAVIRQHLGVHIGNEFHQCAISRHFLLVHGRHRSREGGTNGVRRNEFLVFHGENFRRVGHLRGVHVLFGRIMHGL